MFPIILFSYYNLFTRKDIDKTTTLAYVKLFRLYSIKKKEKFIIQ